MTLRSTVLPLGFGLSAVLWAQAASGEEDPARPKRAPVRVYTNADLDRVHPLREETGIDSVPAVSPGDEPAPTSRDERKGRGEPYWRSEAVRARERIRRMETQAEELRAAIAEQASEAAHLLSGRRRSAASLSGNGSTTRLQARLASLERRMREIEEDLADRARRDGALPGWLRP